IGGPSSAARSWRHAVVRLGACRPAVSQRDGGRRNPARHRTPGSSGSRPGRRLRGAAHQPVRGGSVSVRGLRVVVAAEEYDVAVGFYRDALGMREQAAFAGPGGAEVTILDAGRATFEIANPAQRAYIDEVEVGREVAPRIRLAFEVDDVAGVTRALLAAGATEIATPRPTPFGSVNARLEAPAELQITLFQRDEPAPAAAP